MKNINFLQLVQSMELQGMVRSAIMATVSDSLEAIDKKVKGMKDKLTAMLKPYGAIEGTKLANTLCAPVTGSDDAMRKRLQRRRSTFVSILKSLFTDYDFPMGETEGGQKTGFILCQFVGNESVREANYLLSVMKRITEIYEGNDERIELPSDRDELVDMIDCLKVENQAIDGNAMDTGVKSELARYTTQINENTRNMAELVTDGETTDATEATEAIA